MWRRLGSLIPLIRGWRRRGGVNRLTRRVQGFPWRPWNIPLASLAVGLLLCGASSALAALLINGVGATFAYPIFSKWTYEYNKRVDPSVQINYNSIGSGGGQTQILAQTVDFGATDSPMSDDKLAHAKGKILHIPTVAGADVLTYNLPGNPKLRVDGQTIADIFLGKITKWNDPRLISQNPDLKLPPLDIMVVHRADSSGTTYIWVDYLSSVSKEWETKVGRGASVNWPVGLGAKGNEAVAGQVKQSLGAVGYVELIYAKQSKMAYADVKNAAGNYITPSMQSVAQALAAANIPEDFRFSMVNPSEPTAYPISGVTWFLMYERQPDPAKGRKLVEFLNWALTKGDGMAAELDYAALPESLKARVLQRINSIKY